MIRRMMIGAMVGFILGQLVAFLTLNNKLVTKLFGINKGFFIVLSFVLLLMLISSITLNNRNGA